MSKGVKYWGQVPWDGRQQCRSAADWTAIGRRAERRWVESEQLGDALLANDRQEALHNGGRPRFTEMN